MSLTHSPEETFELGRALGQSLAGGEVLALVGDLGAGKTHFVKGLAAGLGHGQEVTSPTFTLIHEYTGGRVPLYHFDFYRLESEEDVLRIGLDDYLEGKAIVAIEWADKFAALLPAHTRWLHFRVTPEEGRQIEETGHSGVAWDSSP